MTRGPQATLARRAGGWACYLLAARYVRGGRAYTTTPPKCPKSGAWQSRVRFWWADGTDETVVSKHPCTRPAKQKKKQSKRREH